MNVVQFVIFVVVGVELVVEVVDGGVIEGVHEVFDEGVHFFWVLIDVGLGAPQPFPPGGDVVVAFEFGVADFFVEHLVDDGERGFEQDDFPYESALFFE